MNAVFTRACSIIVAAHFLTAADYPRQPIYKRRPPPRVPFRHRQHFYLSAGMLFVGVIDQHTRGADYLSHGFGMGLAGGLRANAHFAADLGMDWSFHPGTWKTDNDIQMDTGGLFAVAARAHLKIILPIVDKVDAHILLGSGYALSFARRYASTWTAKRPLIWANGPILDAGLGLMYQLKPMMSMGFVVLHRLFFFQDPGVLHANSNKISAIALNATLTTHF